MKQIEKISQIVEQKRSEQGLSMRAVARKAGIQGIQISNLLRGKYMPTQATLTKVCDALRCTEEEKIEMFHAAEYLTDEESAKIEHASEECTCKGKLCKYCKQAKCLGHMHSFERGEKTYYVARCRLCANQWRYDWGKANPEKRRETWKKSNKKWLEANPEKGREKDQKYRQIRTRNARAWQRANPERRRHNVQTWYKNNPGKRSEFNRNRRARKKQAKGNFTANEWMQLKIQYNHTCLCCGRKELEIKLTADHVIPLSKGGDNYISNIQPLCHSCNSSKGTKTTDYRTQYTVQEKAEQPLRQQKLF